MASPQVNVNVVYPWATTFQKPPASVEIHGGSYRHEMAVLTYYVQTDWWNTRFRNGSPIIITWGALPYGTDTFYGHVLYTTPHAENERHSLRVVCIGASYPLKDVEATAHPGMSVEQSIATSLRKYQFSLVTDQGSSSWPTLTRTLHESLWSYIIRLAKRVGYVAFVHGTTVYIYNPTDVLLANVTSYPVLPYVYGRGNQSGPLFAFHASLGDDGADEETNYTHSVAGVDIRSGKPLTAKDAGASLRRLGTVAVPPRFEHYEPFPVHSAKEGKQIVSGAKAAKRWVYRAEAQATGNARVTHGGGVVIRGVNSQDDGLWYVDRVVHRLSTEEHPQQWNYLMDIKLLRDSRQQNLPLTSAVRPIRNVVSFANMQSTRKAAPPRLVNGRWMSSAASTTVVAV